MKLRIFPFNRLSSLHTQFVRSSEPTGITTSSSTHSQSGHLNQAIVYFELLYWPKFSLGTERYDNPVLSQTLFQISNTTRTTIICNEAFTLLFVEGHCSISRLISTSWIFPFLCFRLHLNHYFLLQSTMSCNPQILSKNNQT
jgi:hypothetical protein